MYRKKHLRRGANAGKAGHMNPYLVSSMKTLSNKDELLRPYLLRVAKFQIMEPIKAHLRKAFKRLEIKRVAVKDSLKSADVVLIVCAYNEGPRLKFFFEFYRNLGVDHFILLDNDSTDNSVELVRTSNDISIFSARGSYKKSRFGVDWVNYLLSSYCKNKWILFVDVDEFLTFDKYTGLADLIDALEGAGRKSVQSIMLDMYSDAPGGVPRCLSEGQNPLETSPYYDARGYYISRETASNTMWIKGGVRNRLFFDRVGSGPALNKTPLVKWKWHYVFLKSAHQVWPAEINGVGDVPKSALLHFKFVSSSSLYNAEIAARHTSEYSAYTNLQKVGTLIGPTTKTYNGPQGLVGDGIIARPD